MELKLFFLYFSLANRYCSFSLLFVVVFFVFVFVVDFLDLPASLFCLSLFVCLVGRLFVCLHPEKW